MDSINSIAGSLPPDHLANSETELLNNFKAAALSIATLYRSSRQTSKRAYNSGYANACQDLLLMIQQGVSVGGISPSPEGMTVGRVMDWIEARLEAIKSREEEEVQDEDDERDKSRERTRSKASGSKPPQAPKQTTHAPPTPSSPHVTTPVIPTRQASPSPTRQIPDVAPHPFAPSVLGTSSTPLPHQHYPIAAGAKRRHAVMMMLDSSAAPVAIEGPPQGREDNMCLPDCATPPLAGGSGRRRIRSSRASTTTSAATRANAQTQGEAMDVEEDGGGRERKRVARR